MNKDRADQFLEDIRLVSESRHDLVIRLRNLILSVDSGITEEVKYGGILFSSGPPFCGVFSYTNHISLEFSRGSEIADKHHVLEGEGKHRRHIKVVAQSEISKKNIREYVSLALMNLKQNAGGRHAAKTRA
jgi:hypothetical protein